MLDIFFSSWVFCHKHTRFTGQQRKGEAISLTPLYHFHPLHRHLEISRTITAVISPLHIASSWTRTGNIWFSFPFPLILFNFYYWDFLLPQDCFYLKFIFLLPTFFSTSNILFWFSFFFSLPNFLFTYIFFLFLTFFSLPTIFFTSKYSFHAQLFISFTTFLFHFQLYFSSNFLFHFPHFFCFLLFFLLPFFFTFNFLNTLVSTSVLSPISFVF